MNVVRSMRFVTAALALPKALPKALPTALAAESDCNSGLRAGRLEPKAKSAP